MAKNAKKLNALGMNLTPDTFSEVTRSEEPKEPVAIVEEPAVIPEEPVAEVPKTEEPKAEEPAAKGKKAPKKKEEEKEPVGLLSKLASGKAEKKVNTSFTLSPSNITKLQKVAKQKNYTMSACLDEILTELFNEAGL